MPSPTANSTHPHSNDPVRLTINDVNDRRSPGQVIDSESIGDTAEIIARHHRDRFPIRHCRRLTSRIGLLKAAAVLRSFARIHRGAGRPVMRTLRPARKLSDRRGRPRRAFDDRPPSRHTRTTHNSRDCQVMPVVAEPSPDRDSCRPSRNRRKHPAEPTDSCRAGHRSPMHWPHPRGKDRGRTDHDEPVSLCLMPIDAPEGRRANPCPYSLRMFLAHDSQMRDRFTGKKPCDHPFLEFVATCEA